MASFQDNLRAINNILATGPEASYRWNNRIGNWRNGSLRSVSRVPNVYTNQNKIGEKGYTPLDPTTDPFFLENYRNATKSLGAPARALKTRGQKFPNIDTETKAIMDRIKLPSYADAMTEGKRMELAALAAKDVNAAVEKYKKESNEWDEDNFYYKLRAAQKLKKESEKEREGFLKNFDISLYDAKNELDKYVDRRNKEDARNLLTAKQGLQNIVGTVNKKINEGVEDFILRATGNRESYTDNNGVKHTVTFSSGPGDPEELAKRLGDNNSFKLYSKDDYDENGELTDKAKAMGPSAWNSNTTNPDGTPKTETAGTTDTQSDTDEIIEYTYQPGDTFGQVIKKLGLNTDNGLWGPNGDVEYYNKQLLEQGIWEDNMLHNIPIGTTIKLRRRK